MRRFVGSYLSLIVIIILMLAVAGCGGGGNSGGGLGQAVTIELTPAVASVELGGLTGFSAVGKDANGTSVPAGTMTFSSSNTAIGQIATNGLACGGSWDSLTAPVVCTPGAVGTTTITASNGTLTSNAVTLYVHQRIDSIVLTPSDPACVSQNGTVQYAATAFNGATDITATVGPFTFAISDANVGTILAADQPVGQPTNMITVKAKNPGRASVIATNTLTTSVAANFTTCGPASISLHVSGSTDTAFSIATAATKQLAAEVIDTTGATITGVPLTYSSSSAAATVNASALVTGVSPGTANIVASCSPPSCNAGVNTPIYSNPVVATITGTAVVTTAYVTSKDFGATPASSPVVVPIATDSNTPGTAIAIPDIAGVKSLPNSMMVSPQGGRVFIGSNNGLVLLDTPTNAITGTITSTPGKVIGVSPNGLKVVIADTSLVYIYDLGASAFNTLNITGAVAAAFTPDSYKAYIVAGSTLYQFAPNLALRTIPLSAAAPDVTVIGGGQFAYLAGGVASSVTARATCRNDSTFAPEDTVATGTTPALIEAVPGSNAVLAVEAAGEINQITPTIGATTFTTCPVPSLSNAVQTADWSGSGIGAFTPEQIIVTPDGSRAYVTSNQTALLGYTLGTNAAFTVAVGGAQPFNGGALLDSSKVYVGGSDAAVHVVDTATGLQSTQIPIVFGSGATACAACLPNLVVVRPK